MHPIIQVQAWNSYEWLIHGFGIKDVTVDQYIKAYGLEKSWVPKTHQPHGKTVHVLRSKLQDPNQLLEGDAFVTNEQNIIAWVRTADCLPILLVDTKNRAVGAVHAGWRGTAAKIVLETIETMQRAYKTDLASLQIAFGPAICGKCYLVGEDVVQVFQKSGVSIGSWMEEAYPGKWHLDIAFANLSLLEAAGIEKKQVYISLACTACDLEKFHSFRKEGGKKGEQISFIGIR